MHNIKFQTKIKTSTSFEIFNIKHGESKPSLLKRKNNHGDNIDALKTKQSLKLVTNNRLNCNF